MILDLIAGQRMLGQRNRLLDQRGGARCVAHQQRDDRVYASDALEPEFAESSAENSRQHPQPLEPGTYTVVLEPKAVSDLVSLLARSLDARTADEGRSAFAAVT